MRIGNPPHPPRLWDWPSHIPAYELTHFATASLLLHGAAQTVQHNVHHGAPCDRSIALMRYLLIIIFNSNTCFQVYCWSCSDQHNWGMGRIAPCRRPVTWGRITAISSRRTRRERLQGAALAGLSPERCPHTALGACAATARNPNKNKFNYGMDPGAPSPG